MGLLNKLRRKKEKPKVNVEQEIFPSDLQEICADDKESYEVLREIMFLDPRKIDTSLTDAIKKAKEFEKQGDTVKTRRWYEIVLGLAIYKGDVAKVKEYYGKYVKLSPNSAHPNLIKPEEAIKKAQEYYKKHLA